MVDRERYDNYDRQVAESIRSLFELTSRIDERVKLLGESHAKTEAKFDTIMENQQQILQRVVALESRNNAASELKKSVEDLDERMRKFEVQMQAIEILAKGSQNRWDKVLDYTMKVLLAIVATFLIYKLGLTNTNVHGGP